ncbi:hypothetical protein K504DRAFT_468521 [Pleomassaria siparia CBS 279.74]|uniref:Zn(2)-C6 fungal-type domain-containing protein n=1 Tax=Pleomassaria siparia CBS 279.74 TaxID=1314801 RepID=A0A6G1K6A7_9PLEO|nr:hypothetical protein K504DRAFT_468521 [Pleomassaria siparia CBS 279.74]
MVYRGRPSTGCLQCRKRKIKCDERPSGCVKCSARGYTCPGYDNPSDRLFQDESAHVKAKAQRSKAKAIAKRDERDERDKQEKTRTAIVRVQESLGLPLIAPLIDQGINFFMLNYALGSDQPPLQSDAYNRHLSTYGFHPLIATSMTALGLAGISNMCMDANFKRGAMQWYTKALQMTNAALASPTEVRSDNTLFATLLLSTFEATNNEKSLHAWSKHVSGSESLIRMRGMQQFNTPAGRRMYKQAIGLITMNFMGQGRPIPAYIYALNKEVRKYDLNDDPANRLYYLHVDVIDFRAQVLHGKITDLKAIIDRALEIDEIAKTIFNLSGTEWDFEDVGCALGTPGVFGNSYHIYPHVASAQVWNWVRYNRIYLHDIIRNCLVSGFSSTPPAFSEPRYIQLLQESQETLYRMQNDILASIPQHHGDTPNTLPIHTDHSYPHLTSSSNSSPAPAPVSPSPSATSLTSETSTLSSNTFNFFWSNFRDQDFRAPGMRSGISEERIPVVRISGGYSILWALYVAGATPIASRESQEFVLRSMDRVTSEFGINQAKILGNALRLKMHLDEAEKTEFEIVTRYLPKQGGHFEI